MTVSREARKSAPATPTVRSVERAISVLQALLVSSNGLRLVELSEELGLHKTTVLRLLRTLMSMHLVRRSADDRYHWDPLRWVAVARNLTDSAMTLELVEGTLQRLVDETGQTAALWVLDGRERAVILVAAALPTTVLRVDLTTHRWAPLHACAAGKVCLAALPEAAVARYLRTDLRPYTVHTRVDPDGLRAHLAEIRARGYATNDEEIMLGTGGLSVSVRDDLGGVTGSLGLAGPIEQFSPEAVACWLPLLRAAAEQLSEVLYLAQEGTAGRAGKSQGGVVGDAVPRDETGLWKSYRAR